MTEQELDDADVGSIFEQMNSEGVSQGMGRDRFGNAGPSVRFLALALNGSSGDGMVRTIAGKEPMRRPVQLPPVA